MLTQGTQREYEALVAAAPFSVGGFVLPSGKYLREGDSNAAEFFSWDEVTRPTNGGVVSDGQTLKRIALIKDTARPSASRHSRQRSTVRTGIHCRERKL